MRFALLGNAASILKRENGLSAKKKQFFFEKKNQKTFDYIEPGGA